MGALKTQAFLVASPTYILSVFDFGRGNGVPAHHGAGGAKSWGSGGYVGEMLGKIYFKMFGKATTHLGGRIPEMLEYHEQLSGSLRSA